LVWFRQAIAAKQIGERLREGGTEGGKEGG
jgi:hypothetical protein